jgi:hypothetical protein
MDGWLPRIFTALGVSALVLGVAGAANAGLSSTDRPGGFLYGTDSWPIPVPGTGPYQEPVLGSPYGGYIGMTGNWDVK